MYVKNAPFWDQLLLIGASAASIILYIPQSRMGALGVSNLGQVQCDDDDCNDDDDVGPTCIVGT